MAKEYNVLQAINMMLASRAQSDRERLSNALQVMQIGQAKRLGERRLDIQEATANMQHDLETKKFAALLEQQEKTDAAESLKYLSERTNEYSIDSAERFLTDTGLSGIWQSFSKEGKDQENVVKKIQKQYKVDKVEAHRLTGAMNSYYVTGKSGSVLGIISELDQTNKLIKSQGKPQDREYNLFESLFMNTAYGGVVELVENELGEREGRYTPGYIRGEKKLNTAMTIMGYQKEIKREFDELMFEGDTDISSLKDSGAWQYGPEQLEQNQTELDFLAQMYNDFTASQEGAPEAEVKSYVETQRDEIQDAINNLAENIDSSRTKLTDQKTKLAMAEMYKESGYAMNEVDLVNMSQNIKEIQDSLDSKLAHMDDLARERKVLATSGMLEGMGVPVTTENIETAMDKLEKQQRSAAEGVPYSTQRMMITGY